ncbi:MULTISPECIES: hypothetical protein [Pseudomonas]|uniref:hypothetical protein n=1 Tax=Pseudomonas TaxID=286 RepID=UPI000371193A|nr:hypothetical protein [Pseudomonas syringae]
MQQPPQTPLQRRYYWAVVRHIALTALPDQILSQAEQDLHRELKGIILGYEDVPSKSGASETQPISTSGLTREEFTGFIEAVISIGVQAGVPFPDNPEDLLDVCPNILPHRLPIPKVLKKCE